MAQKLRILFGVVFTVICSAAVAQPMSVSRDQAPPSSPVAKANADVLTAARQYKSSVQALIPHYENNLKTATEALEKRKELFAKGLVSKLDLDAGDRP